MQVKRSLAVAAMLVTARGLTDPRKGLVGADWSSGWPDSRNEQLCWSFASDRQNCWGRSHGSAGGGEPQQASVWAT
jgi:hypothetical protein